MPRSLSMLAGGWRDLLAPARCVDCGELLRSVASGPELCESCRAAWLGDPRCRCVRCAAPLPGSREGDVCHPCSAEPPPFVGAVAAGDYQGALRAAILHSKSGRGAHLATGRWPNSPGRPVVQRSTSGGPTSSVRFPRTGRDGGGRGGDSIEVVAGFLASPPGTPCRKLLYRRKATRFQYELTPKGRQANLRRASPCAGG